MTPLKFPGADLARDAIEHFLSGQQEKTYTRRRMCSSRMKPGSSDGQRPQQSFLQQHDIQSFKKTFNFNDGFLTIVQVRCVQVCLDNKSDLEW